MKSFRKAFISVATVTCLLSLSSFSVHAASVEVPNDLPQGEVQLDDHDNVVASSSSLLVPTASPKLEDKHDLYNLVSSVNLTAINLPNGRWVYYSDHHNYFNGYKWGHSNYVNWVQDHTATAKVGDSSSVVRKPSGQWAYATAKGYGTFQAFYNNITY
ncbi:hypothetical protein AALT52_05450 [Ligilactobacillus faecis]|uniref:Bacteriocin n=1 Tax=Ligilactobacillus faecis TaxID=762833 RepID=A0ABV4DPC2_9LACO